MSKRLLCGWILWFALVHAVAGQTATITLDGQGPGRTFEGLGALSAGASSRLLPDYPEPQRSQVLDFLFKPNFGAALQHLKVEIGGDINSTDGTEPSYARTREEFEHPRPEYFDRGYEWWLMREAKKRNPQIYLDVLQWGAPDWIGDKDFPDAGDPNTVEVGRADAAEPQEVLHAGQRRFHRRFHSRGEEVSRRGHRLLRHLERNPVRRPWIKLLAEDVGSPRPVDRSGSSPADQTVDIWNIVERVERDAELKKAVTRSASIIRAGRRSQPCPAVCPQPAGRPECGKPLWSSEDGPWRGDWAGACALAKMYNRNYIDGRMTKTVIWSLISSYYDNLPLPNSGPMKANTPWSGHYEVQPALWAIAHTTQFAQPGWKYLDSACGLLKRRRQLRLLAKPRGRRRLQHHHRDHRCQDAANAFVPPNRRAGDRAGARLAQQPAEPVRPTRRHCRLTDDSFTIVLEPGCYLLADDDHRTAEREDPAIPPPADFPMPYQDDFEDSSAGQVPKYFADQGGVFEVADRPDGGKCLRQTVARRGIDWNCHPNPDPYTMIGSTQWRDYEVSCDVHTSRSRAMRRSSAASSAARQTCRAAEGILAEGGHGRPLGTQGVHQDIGRRQRLVCRRPLAQAGVEVRRSDHRCQHRRRRSQDA